MSHIAEIKIQIRDLDALTAAAKKLGLEFRRDQKQHRYYAGKMSPCDHALTIAGAIGAGAGEIGVVRKEGSTYGLNWDSYGGGGGLVAKVGQKAEKLVQGYAVEVAVREAMRKGFRVVSNRVRQDGKVELELVK